MVSSEGGVEIEKVAEETPEKLQKYILTLFWGLNHFKQKNLPMP